MPQATLLAAYIVGTFDTKPQELCFVRDLLVAHGIKTITVDLSTYEKPSNADVTPTEVANCHPHGAEAVFTGDRGTAVTAMATAFSHFITAQSEVGGIISLGGSGGTALATPAMQQLPIGLPKMMVSTVAAGEVSGYVGSSDICMLYSVVDIAGLNRISRRVFANAANALAGMMNAAAGQDDRRQEEGKPAIGLTMFGVTTPCVQAVSTALQSEFDCLVFHATGSGGRAMGQLVESKMLAGVLDLTTTEVCDLLFGGVMSAGEDRFTPMINAGIPYVGACGALDMVNFGGLDTLPEKHNGRNLYVHNAEVTLMRTSIDENRLIGKWIARQLNQFTSEVRFFIPEKGVSALDADGQQFYDPDADQALFDALHNSINQTAKRKLIRLPYHINDAEFATAVAAEFTALMATSQPI